MTDLIERAKAALEGATPGPWAYEAHGDTMTYGVGVCHEISDIEMAFPLSGQVSSDVIVTEPVCPEVNGHENARLIALAPDMARALIAANELADACEKFSAEIDDPMGRPGSARVAMLLALAAFRAATKGQDR